MNVDLHVYVLAELVEHGHQTVNGETVKLHVANASKVRVTDTGTTLGLASRKSFIVRLDADGDGLIQAEETRRYPDEILGTLEAGLWISAGKRRLHLTTLHPPEVDLLENEAAGAHPL